MDESKISKINTGMTMVEMKGNTVKQLEAMSETERDFAISEIEKFITNSKPRMLMLLSNELRYYTVFELKESDLNKTARNIVDFIETEGFFTEIGQLKLIDVESDHVEVWVEDKFFALFNCDGFLVEI